MIDKYSIQSRQVRVMSREFAYHIPRNRERHVWAVARQRLNEMTVVLCGAGGSSDWRLHETQYKNVTLDWR